METVEQYRTEIQKAAEYYQAQSEEWEKRATKFSKNPKLHLHALDNAVVMGRQATLLSLLDILASHVQALESAPIGKLEIGKQTSDMMAHFGDLTYRVLTISQRLYELEDKMIEADQK